MKYRFINEYNIKRTKNAGQPIKNEKCKPERHKLVILISEDLTRTGLRVLISQSFSPHTIKLHRYTILDQHDWNFRGSS